LIIGLYVDEDLIFANDESEKLRVKNVLMPRFEMKELRKAQKVLGIRTRQEKRTEKLIKPTLLMLFLTHLKLQVVKLLRHQ
jgi:hypothetical protein